jgi:hypothetical protein
MNSNKGIVWLASYPKSGNTWFRIVLANMLNTSENPVSLNQINLGIMATERTLMNQVLGFNSSLLYHDELEPLRPSIYQWFAQQSPHNYCYIKIHDAYYSPHTKTTIVPQQSNTYILYFIRNPFDVSISFAHHFNCSIDDAIKAMGKKAILFNEKDRATSHVGQFWSSWSSHVKSWTLDCDLNVLVLRYEDMSFLPQKTFSQAAQFLNLNITDEKIAKAIEDSRFENLQQQEKNFGFKERTGAPNEIFFRKGKVGDWKNTLSQAQINKIIHDHGEMMHLYGYLNDQAEPISNYQLAADAK